MNRNNTLTALMQNITDKDREMYKQRYIPISWLLARISYEEATTLLTYDKTKLDYMSSLRVKQ